MARTQTVIVYKVIRRASGVGKRVWCETNIGVIKKPINGVPSIALKAFEAREQEEYWVRERAIANCTCKNQKPGRNVFIGESEGNYHKCVNCGGKIWS